MQTDSDTIRLQRQGILHIVLGEHEFDIDVAMFVAEWNAIAQQYEDGTGAELPHYLALLRKFNAPPDISGQECLVVMGEVAKRCGAQKKSTDSAVSSAGPTTSTPGS